MKLSFSHKKPILVGGGILIVISIFLLFTTCDIGLGQIVNTEKPVIQNAGENAPGAFLQGGSNTIELNVENKLGFGIKEVYMEVEYRDIKTGFTERKKVPAKQNPETGKWEVDLDVSDMMDGKISTWVTAEDESGNKSTSTEIVYFVKNMLPQIKLTIPNVSDKNFDNPEFLDDIAGNDQIYQGLDIMGLATDDFKIADGYPQIMFWPSNMNPLELDIDGIPLETDLKNGAWRTVVMPENRSSTATKFSWPLVHLIQDPNAPDGTGYRLPVPDTTDPWRYLEAGFNTKYRFRIRIKDGFGNMNYYPDRIDNTRGEGGTPADPSTAPRKYIEVTHMTVGDKPIVQVPNPKRFYNVVGDFVVDFGVIAGDSFVYTDDCVECWVTDKNDGTGSPIGGITVYAKTNGSPKSPYQYRLTFTEDQAKTWTPPANGMLFVAIQAKNGAGETGPIDFQNFTLDLDPPVVVIDQPNLLTNKFKTGAIRGGNYTVLYPPAYKDSTTRPNWKTATVTVGGTCEDAIQIDKVYYHIGKVSPSDDKTADLSTFYDDGNFPWKDTGLGSATPAANWSGSVYAWKYSEYFAIGYKNGASGVPSHASIVQELSELGFVYNSAMDKDYGTTGADFERFYLPFYVKVVDVAGNRQIVHYKLSIDPVLDKPQVTIIYPAEGKTVGGTVRVTGSAEDNFWMHKVLMRIHKKGDGSDNPSNPAYYYIPSATVPAYSEFYKTFTSYPKPQNGAVDDTAGWFEITSVGDGPTVNWTATVNGDGKLNPVTGDNVDVKIEVVAIDIPTTDPSHTFPNTVGPVETRNVIFSSKVPTIENVKITTSGTTVDYNDGISAAGKFTIKMTVSANKGINLLSAKVNTNPPVNLVVSNKIETTIDGAVWTLTPLVEAGDKTITDLTITVDSTKDGIVTGLGYGKTGIMNLEITATDMTESNFSTTNNFRIGIDNFYPSAEILTPLMAYDELSTNPNVTSKYFLVQGTASDSSATSGQIQGLERMVVWFEKARITYTNTTTWAGRKVESLATPQMLKPDGSTATSSDFQEHLNVMDTTKPLLSNPAEPNVKTNFSIPKLVFDNTIQRWTSPSAMVIDSSENDPESDFDKDGTYGEKWDTFSYPATWGARMFITKKSPTNVITTNFSDGPYIVHYLIMDKAGNATYYQKDIFVENNKPRITQVNIGTDINFDNNLTDWTSTAQGEYRKNPYLIDNTSEGRGTQWTPYTEFKIRNRIFGVRLTVERGTGSKQAVISYVTEGAAEIPVSSMERGKVYKISTTAADTDFTKYGSPNGYKDTVFVATCSGSGDGKVIPYNTLAGTEQSFTLGIGTVNLPCKFTGFTNVPDSTAITNSTPAGQFIGGLFIVKVYDTVITTTPANPADQLAHAILLSAFVNNNDTEPPSIAVADFGQKYIASEMGVATDYNANVLTSLASAVYSDYVDTTNKGVKNGYVQYQAHSTPARANISGKVIFNGKVNDNHYITRITATIPNYNSGTEFNIATRNTTTGEIQASSSTSGDWEFRFTYDQTEVPQYSLEYGNTIVWKFMWDSSKFTPIAQDNVSITFKVYDQGSTAPSTAKSVNIVPYISEIRTPLSGAYSSNPSAFNRSALGGYPVREGDTIILNGFNLGTFTANTGTNSVAIGTQNLTYAANGTYNGIAYTRSNTQLGVTVPTTTVSGPLVVTVNGVTSFNNRSNKNKSGGNFVAPYNQEPNNINNNILDNSRYMYVWSTGYLVLPTGAGGQTGGTGTGFITPANTRSPFMRVDSTGNRYIVFGWHNGTNSELRVVKNNTNTKVEQDVNRYINNTIAFDSYGDWYAASTNITSSAQYFFNFYARAAVNDVNANHNRDSRDNKRRLSEVGSNSDRFKVPRIAVMHTNNTAQGSQNNADRIYMSYYDSNDKNLIFHFGTVGNSNQFGQNIATDNAPTQQIVANSTTVNNGSIYSAVGYMSNGRPLIAWYDDTNACLVFSYGNGNPTNTTYNNADNIVTTNTTGANSWQTNARRVTPVGSGQGQHVDMAVDGDNVHLAYYDVNNGGLYYAYIPSASVVSNSAAISTYKVDTYLSAGTKIMLNVRNGIPYITYYHGAFTDTKNSIRVAWRKGTLAAGTDDSDTFTGAWEVMTVPVGTVPLSGEFICNGVPTANSSWTDANMPASTTLTRYPNIQQSILLGYFTNSWYEGAILKGDMTTTPTELTK